LNSNIPGSLTVKLKKKMHLVIIGSSYTGPV
jgi:hypothetical protein